MQHVHTDLKMNRASKKQKNNELLEKNIPSSRLWARMLCFGCHDDYENPPSIPAFVSIAPKKQWKDNLSEALAGAA